MAAQAAQALRDVLAGGAAAVGDLVDQAALLHAASGIGSLVVSALAVRKVLEAYSAGVISAAEAQRWAFFVRQGFLPEAVAPVHPLDINFESAFEDPIAAATTRLEELGDEIDGELLAQEVRHLLASLA